MTVLVAGGSIGRLAATLTLAQGGWDVTSLERAAAFGEVGAGIQLEPIAFACFDALDLGAAVRAMAVFIDQLRLIDAFTGAEIAQIPLDAPFRTWFGNPYAVVHRGNLRGVFLHACQAHPTLQYLAKGAPAWSWRTRCVWHAT